MTRVDIWTKQVRNQKNNYYVEKENDSGENGFRYHQPEVRFSFPVGMFSNFSTYQVYL